MSSEHVRHGSKMVVKTVLRRKRKVGLSVIGLRVMMKKNQEKSFRRPTPFF